MRKWTLGVVLRNLSNCICVFAEFCKWQMRLCTSKPCNVHPTSVLLWKRGRRDRERRVKRRAEHTGEYWPGHLFILRAKPVFLFLNNKSPIPWKENESFCDWIIVRENSSVLMKICVGNYVTPSTANKDWNPVDTSCLRAHTDRENTHRLLCQPRQ